MGQETKQTISYFRLLTVIEVTVLVANVTDCTQRTLSLGFYIENKTGVMIQIENNCYSDRKQSKQKPSPENDMVSSWMENLLFHHDLTGQKYKYKKKKQFFFSQFHEVWILSNWRLNVYGEKKLQKRFPTRVLRHKSFVTRFSFYHSKKDMLFSNLNANPVTKCLLTCVGKRLRS